MHYSQLFYPWLERTKPELFEDIKNLKPGVEYPTGKSIALTPEGGMHNLYQNEDDAREMVPKDIARQKTQDALRYEGDSMGHCVGGYGDAVACGDSRIFSLRDAQGKPHVTIEVHPPIGSEKAAKDEFRQTYGRDPMDQDEFLDWVDESDFNTNENPNIVQIKGKGNAKPVDKYIPYVQDFVKNQGPWSDVGDFRHTDLIDTGDESFPGSDLSAIDRNMGHPAVKDMFRKLAPPKDVTGGYPTTGVSLSQRIKEAITTPEDRFYSLDELNNLIPEPDKNITP